VKRREFIAALGARHQAIYRRVKLSWRYPSAMVPVQGGVRQLRRHGKPHRRPAELEGSAGHGHRLARAADNAIASSSFPMLGLRKTSTWWPLEAPCTAMTGTSFPLNRIAPTALTGKHSVYQFCRRRR
jgi:hypothetical protein